MNGLLFETENGIWIGKWHLVCMSAKSTIVHFISVWFGHFLFSNVSSNSFPNLLTQPHLQLGSRNVFCLVTICLRCCSKPWRDTKVKSGGIFVSSEIPISWLEWQVGTLYGLHSFVICYDNGVIIVLWEFEEGPLKLALGILGKVTLGLRFKGQVRDI